MDFETNVSVAAFEGKCLNDLHAIVVELIPRISPDMVE